MRGEASGLAVDREVIRGRHSPRELVALLGRRDVPTDRVRDNYSNLSEALGRRGATLTLAEVAWEKHGWFHALSKLGGKDRLRL